MTPEQISAVEESFKLVAPISGQAAALFYEKLFTLDPGTRALFTGDMTEQGRKLMAMIEAAVLSLRKPEALLPVVRSLGVRHVSYGVRDSHYDSVGAALISTLEQGLGEHFTPDVRAAWLACYTLLAAEMRAAAAQAA